jgi:hypothetical protein
MSLTKDFWDLPPACKYDVFEDQQARLIMRALADIYTQVEPNSRDDWTVSGPEDALLVRVQNVPINLALLVLWSFLSATATK